MSELLDGGHFSSLDSGSLQIIDAKKNDSGTYQCVATNSEGSASITAGLDVKGIAALSTVPL